MAYSSAHMTPASRKTAPDDDSERAAHSWPLVAVGDTPADEAWRLLFRFIQTCKETFPALAAEFDLSPAQARLLFELDGRVPMSRLAEALSCDASNVTGLVDRLETRGLIERQTDGNDRRVKIIAVTDAGVAIREKLLRRFARPPTELGRLSASDLRELARILARALGD